MSQITPCCQPAAHTTWPCSCGSFDSAFAFVGENFLRLSTHFCAIFCSWPKAPPQTIRLNLAPNITILSSKRSLTNCLTSIYYLKRIICGIVKQSMFILSCWDVMLTAGMIDKMYFFCNFLTTYASPPMQSLSQVATQQKWVLKDSTRCTTSSIYVACIFRATPHVALQIILQINHFCLHRLLWCNHCPSELEANNGLFCAFWFSSWRFM